MPPRWALAFSIAALLSLAVSAGLRARSRRGNDALRRYGGFAVVAGALAGSAATPSMPAEIAVGLAAALCLALVALAVEQRALPTMASRVAVVAAAGAVVGAGARLEITGLAAADVAVTLGCLVLVTFALEGLGDTPGLAPGISGALAGGVFALAAFGDQDGLATVAVAVGGACVGFLAYNAAPASLFMGRPARLFVGFVVAVQVLEVQGVLDRSDGRLASALLVALVLVDASAVALGRVVHARRLLVRRRDHLVHRFERAGLGRGAAVALLVSVQLALSVVAVFTGRGVLRPTPAILATLGLLVVIVAAAARGRVYDEPRRMTVRARVVAIAIVAAGAALVVPASIRAWEADRAIDDGREAVAAALTSARAGEPEIAARRFDDAVRSFERAEDLLHAPTVSVGLAVPGLGVNLSTARELADLGTDLARAGVSLTENVDPQRLRVVDGGVDLAEVRRVAPDLADAARLLEDSDERLSRLDRAYLVGPVQNAIDVLDHELDEASTDATRGSAAARHLPAILGGEGPRRYFLAVQNSAELRATGGFIGNYGILVAENGKVRLEEFERISVLNRGGDSNRTLNAPEAYRRRYERFAPAQTWQNVNMSPDFPTVGALIADLYPQSGGEPVDGVIAVDPVGLAALLELTGPIEVEGWTTPITKANVVDVTLRDAYSRFADDPEREDFLGAVAERVADVATTADLGAPSTIGRVLGRAAHEGHIMLWFSRPEEQSLAETLGAAGMMPPVGSDSLALVTQNAAGNKLDYYLHRSIEYSVELRPDADLETASVRARVVVELTNGAPPGLPRIVAGPYDERFDAGENRSFVSLYTPLDFVSATVNGTAANLEAAPELHRNVYSTFASTPLGATTVIELELAGEVRLDGDGWYRLDLFRQPSLDADEMTVEVEVPKGWRIGEATGLRATGERTTSVEHRLDHTTTIGLRVDRSTDSNLWDRLAQGG